MLELWLNELQWLPDHKHVLKHYRQEIEMCGKNKSKKGTKPNEGKAVIDFQNGRVTIYTTPKPKPVIVPPQKVVMAQLGYGSFKIALKVGAFGKLGVCFPGSGSPDSVLFNPDTHNVSFTVGKQELQTFIKAAQALIDQEA